MKPREPYMPSLPVCSLFQPWASLIAIDRKQIETRSWPAPRDHWSKPLGIHATAKLDPEHLGVLELSDVRALEYVGHGRFDGPKVGGHMFGYVGGLPQSAVVAVCTLAECLPVPADRDRHEFDQQLAAKGYNPYNEARLGDMRPGRWLWLLKDIVRLPSPVPARGHQRIWPAPPEVVDEIGRQLREGASRLLWGRR